MNTNRESEKTSGNVNERVVLNVGGQRFHTYLGTLKTVPHTRLCWLAERHPFSSEYDRESGEYFFDRHSGIFQEVLNYYRTGKLHYPTSICALQYSEELTFWGINSQNMESCCWVRFQSSIKNDKSLKSYEGETENCSTSSVKRFRRTTTNSKVTKLIWKKYRNLIWEIVDRPSSSKISKAYLVVSSVLILLMLMQFCLGSIPSINGDSRNMYVLKKLFEASSIFFTLDFLVRVLFCPSKLIFVKSPLNWVDLLTVLPFYVGLFSDNDTVTWFLPLKLLRVYRLFSLSDAFQIMLRAVFASLNELVLGLGTIIIPVILFSCYIYLAERNENPQMFANVPESFWWAVVTMTTLGYGDKVPSTAIGKAIGIACALCGVVLIALPISVIGNNFYFHYTQARTRKKKPSKEIIATAVAHLPLMNLRVLGSSNSNENCINVDTESIATENLNTSNNKTVRRKLVAIS